ncbi:M67 family metallopeptidase [Telmatospirillum sp.]|uniref:M67 family metallopeptidase n=1 Tax=Telmatospirillum sp. TaxID=2079197 RepID=UPI00284EB3CC|nr:M67 family metallopeptidase [Telmatospirillum sp.]MDR3437435.1 M67 family metallopeptidase [Telmatospirillum sp.]
MLTVTPDVLTTIIAHAREQAPIEACGYLAEKDGVTSKVFRLTNADASAEHFSLLPAEQFAAVRAMRLDGYRLRAVYHSHPASPARMSEEDIRLAIDPSLSYVIVSLASPQPVVKAFTILRKVEEESIAVAGAAIGKEH